MRPLRIKGKTVTVGLDQRYFPVHIREETWVGTDHPEGVPMMKTLWQPTPEELTAMLNGAPVVLCILGTRWPPMQLYVDPTEEVE